MEALLGVIVGGVITLTTTVLVDNLRFRRERRYRWDDERLETMSQFVAAANRAISALYDKGVAVAHNPTSSEESAGARREARAAVDDLRIQHFRARLVNPSLASTLTHLMEE